jgi:hypothetical protein
MRVENSGDVTINNSLKVSNVINSSNVIRSFSNSTLGYASMNVGTTTNAGYIEIFRPNLQRSLYLGYATATGPNSYVAENGAWHAFSGGKVQIFNNIEAYKGIFSDNVKTSLQYQGGFGAMNTSGVADWSDITNTVSGNGYTLLLGTATNGNGIGAYYHPFNFEYSSKDGTGNICQMAIPYNGSDMWLRGRYSGAYTPWKTYIQSSKIQDVGNNDVIHSGNVSGYNNNASNLTLGTLLDARLSANIPKLNQANTYTNFNSFEGGMATRFETINIRNTAVALINSTGFDQLNTGELRIRANISVAEKFKINTLNELDVSAITTLSATTIANKIGQAYAIALAPAGSTTLAANAAYIVFNARSGTFNPAGEVFTINLPATPGSNTQQIDFAFEGILAPNGLALNLVYNGITTTVRVDLTSTFSDIYKITTASNSTFRIRYNSVTNKWKVLQVNNY